MHVDIALSTTREHDNVIFSGITSTCVKIFTSQYFISKKPISVYFNHTRLQYLACYFHVSDTAQKVKISLMENFIFCAE